MDDYRDIDESYTRALERIILDAGLKLPSIWGEARTKDEIKQHNSRVSKHRAS